MLNIIHTTDQVVGAIKEYSGDDVRAGALEEAVATKVLQTYIASLDGMVRVPLTYEPTASLSGNGLSDYLLEYITHFANEGIWVVTAVTDGTQVNRHALATVKKTMATKGLSFAVLTV